MFEIALAKLGGVEGQTWMIGDNSEADIEGAKSAVNATTIQFLTQGVKSATQADATVASFQELRILLRNSLKN